MTLTLDSKLRELQLKILHRVYASNSYVSRFSAEKNEQCELCNTKYDLCHLFYACSKIQKFWLHFKNWFTDNQLCIQINLRNVIFGTIEPKSFIQNFCLLHAKCYIHKQHRDAIDESKYNPTFYHFLSYLKYVLITEREIACHKGKLKIYNDVFTQLVSSVNEWFERRT